MPNYLNPLRYLYNGKRWHAIRTRVLAEHPLCQRCQAKGKVVPATVCNHLVPHEGNERLFWDGPFQALCKPCHDGPARKEETGQAATVDYATDIASLGSDGWPLDPWHPANRGASSKKVTRPNPASQRPSRKVVNRNPASSDPFVTGWGQSHPFNVSGAPPGAGEKNPRRPNAKTPGLLKNQ